MSIIDSLGKRRSNYSLSKELPVSKETVIDTVKKVTSLVPDAFNSRSARVAVLFGEKHDAFWDGVYDAFGGKVTREKIASFRNGAGTILYFYDETVIKGLQEKFPSYRDNFPLYARDANGMLQISIWTALKELGIGANLQHYNPVIDDLARSMCGVPESYKLVAQMPFGTVTEPPRDKDAEDISRRVTVTG